jgi:hypothetical protein
MPIRDAKTPSATELDQLAEITEADLDDAARILKQRVPEAAPAVDATVDESPGRATGPIPDEQ